MATLKDHQQAMVDLMASGSGIPASAMRLAHAMHDVLCCLTDVKPITLDMKSVMRQVQATSPGLNDKALAADVEACRPKDTMFDRARAAERRVKELENTVNQLRAANATMREELAKLRVYVEHDALPEQSGCRKDDAQACEHVWKDNGRLFVCRKCGVHPSDVPDGELRGSK